MSNSKLIELSYYDPSAQVRLSAYADTLVLDHDQNGSIIRAIRFGGYPEMVRAMADAIYGGATIEAAQNDTTRMLQSSLKSYQRQITHDGIYAVATLMAADTVQEDDRSGKHEKDEDTNLVDIEDWLALPENSHVARMYRRSVKGAYTIVHSWADADQGEFPSPSGVATFTDREKARAELNRLVTEEKENMEIPFSKELYREEYGNDFWEAYRDGYAAGWFTRYEIIESPLFMDKEGD